MKGKAKIGLSMLVRMLYVNVGVTTCVKAEVVVRLQWRCIHSLPQVGQNTLRSHISHDYELHKKKKRPATGGREPPTQITVSSRLTRRSLLTFAPLVSLHYVFIHCKQLVDSAGLQRGNTVSYDTEYVRKYKAFNCTVTSSGGGGDEGWSGVDVAVPESQQEIVKAVHLTPQV